MHRSQRSCKSQPLAAELSLHSTPPSFLSACPPINADMEHKEGKLDEQFQALAAAAQRTALFAGVAIHVNGITTPSHLVSLLRSLSLWAPQHAAPVRPAPLLIASEAQSLPHALRHVPITQAAARLAPGALDVRSPSASPALVPRPPGAEAPHGPARRHLPQLLPPQHR